MEPNIHDHSEEDDKAEPPVPELPADEDDLYACLNVSRTATTDDITAAYRRLSRMYHPDKHIDIENKQNAENLFGRIKKAHQVLSDPTTRAIYDTVGLSALENPGYELVLKYQTPQEIRETYERINREKAELEIERKTNPKGQVTVSINATELFNPWVTEDDPYYADSPVPLVELTGFNFSQSIEAPLTTTETLVLSGSVNADNGRGRGNINCGLRKTFSNRAHGEIEIGGSTSGFDFGLKGFAQFGKRYFTNCSIMCMAADRIIRPGVVVAVGNQLDANTVGTLTWRGGNANSLTAALIRNKNHTRCGLSLQLGFPHSFAMVHAAHSIEDMKVRANVKAGTFGALIEYGVEKKISQLSTIGATMIVGIPHGVMLRLKVVRANQTYLFPIQLSEELAPSAIFYGTVAPVILYFTVHKLIIEPYQQEKQRKEREKLRMEYRTKMREKRAEADGAVTLMKVSYERIVAEEQQKNGLLITSATYGRVVVGSGEQPILDDEIIDVRVALQCLVIDSSLVLHQGTKSSLPGFYDPAPGETKSLLVHYTFRNEAHQILLPDEDELRIPRRAHKLAT